MDGIEDATPERRHIAAAAPPAPLAIAPRSIAQPLTLATLPYDIMHLILSHFALEDLESLISLAQLSRGWRALVDRESVWKAHATRVLNRKQVSYSSARTELVRR